MKAQKNKNDRKISTRTWNLPGRFSWFSFGEKNTSQGWVGQFLFPMASWGFTLGVSSVEPSPRSPTGWSGWLGFQMIFVSVLQLVIFVLPDVFVWMFFNFREKIYKNVFMIHFQRHLLFQNMQLLVFFLEQKPSKESSISSWFCLENPPWLFFPALLLVQGMNHLLKNLGYAEEGGRRATLNCLYLVPRMRVRECQQSHWQCLVTSTWANWLKGWALGSYDPPWPPTHFMRDTGIQQPETKLWTVRFHVATLPSEVQRQL